MQRVLRYTNLVLYFTITLTLKSMTDKMNFRHVTIVTLMLSLTAALASGCGVGEASVASDTEVEAATPIPVETALPSRAGCANGMAGRHLTVVART